MGKALDVQTIAGLDIGDGPRGSDSPRPPVLAFGAGVTLLGVVRSFARAGTPVYVASRIRDFVTRSRWYVPTPETLPETADPARLAAFLDRLPYRRAVLVACSDAWSAAVAGLDGSIRTRFPASISSPAVQAIFLDKAALRRVLAEIGIPHPKTIEIGSEADLEGLDEREFDGAFLKPRDSQSFSALFGVKAFPCRGKSDAIARYREAASHGLEMMVQDYIPGPPTFHRFVDGFVDRSGRSVARFARRRVRMHPPDFGNSSCLVSVPLAEVADAVESLDRLLAHVGYRGIFSAEFKYDARDGRHKLLEVNARPWWYVGFATDCGVDVCRMAYQDSLGRPVTPVAPYAIGKTCTFAQLDWVRCRELYRAGDLSLLDWIREWTRSSHPIFSWEDPAPFVENAIRLLPRILGRDAGGGR